VQLFLRKEHCDVLQTLLTAVLPEGYQHTKTRGHTAPRLARLASPQTSRCQQRIVISRRSRLYNTILVISPSIFIVSLLVCGRFLTIVLAEYRIC